MGAKKGNMAWEGNRSRHGPFFEPFIYSMTPRGGLKAIVQIEFALGYYRMRKQLVSLTAPVGKHCLTRHVRCLT